MRLANRPRNQSLTALWTVLRGFMDKQPKYMGSALAFSLFFSATVFSATALAAAPAESASRLLDQVPVRFEPNQGQANSVARWTARGLGYSFAFTQDATLLHYSDRIVALIATIVTRGTAAN